MVTVAQPTADTLSNTVSLLTRGSFLETARLCSEHASSIVVSTLYSNSTRAVSRLQLVWVLMKFYTHCSQRKHARVQTFCFVHTNATHDSTEPSACVTNYETNRSGPRGDSLWSVCKTKMQNLETAATFSRTNSNSNKWQSEPEILGEKTKMATHFFARILYIRDT